jgi:hypothetical protein
MKRMLCLMAVFLLLGVCAFGQERDSLIIGFDHALPGQMSINIPVWAVVFDSIYSYNLGFRWYDPINGVTLSPEISYFPPLTEWDVLQDSVNNDLYWVSLAGVSNIDSIINPPLHTDSLRVQVFSLQFNIANSFPDRVVTIDTMTIGTFNFGNNPAIRIGGFTVGPRPAVYEDINSISKEFSVGQNYPNPFNTSTMIEFSLSKDEDVTLVIYDLLGRRVRILQNGRLAEGSYSVVWDGKDDADNDVSSGTYFYRLSTGDDIQIKRMTLVR